MADPEGKTDKSPKWEGDHPNPSGIFDEHPMIHKHNDQVHFLEKKPQEMRKEHHEEGSSL